MSNSEANASIGVDNIPGIVGGSVTKVDLWGKKKMAYQIRKQKEGQYVILYTQMEPSFCVELERQLRLAEPVMRFMIVAPETAPAMKEG